MDFYNALAAKACIEYHAQQDATEFGLLLKLVGTMYYGQPILEIGSHNGGSLYAWNQVAPGMVEAITKSNVANEHGTHVIIGDSHNPNNWDKIKLKPGFIFVDGDHTFKGCIQDICKAKYRYPNATIAIHDINTYKRIPGLFGVATAWQLMQKMYPHITIENIPNEDPGVGIIFPERIIM